MRREDRMNEITTSMKSFSKTAYHKSEVLPELLQLQKELIEVVFDKEHAANGNLKIWDIERHFEHMSTSNGCAGADELRIFKNGCKEICNRIKAEISGNWGEDKTFQRLESMRCSGKVIRNIELTSDDIRTELDGVVITSKAIFLVEVKNTRKNIFIDEVGNYYRTGEYMNLDSNIGEKMRNKVTLLRDALVDLGLSEMNIESLIVFTNNRMEVSNHFNEIKTCFLGQLPYIIEENKGRDIYSEDDIVALIQKLEIARCKEYYKYDLDIDQFKKDFALVVSILEEASSNNEKEKEYQEESKREEKDSHEEVHIPDFLKKEEKKHIALQRDKVLASVGGLAVMVGIAIVALSKSMKSR